MDGIGPLIQRKGNNLIHIKVSLNRSARGIDHVRFIRFGAEERHLILLGINCTGRTAQLMAGADDPYSNFAAIGDQYFFKLFKHPFILSKRNDSFIPILAQKVLAFFAN